MASTISSLGVGSGLDLNGIVSKLMAVERQPLTALATKEAGYQAKISAFGSIKGVLTDLQSAANTLSQPGIFTGLSATSSSTSVLTASASTTASEGAYSIGVTQLAKYHAVRSTGNYTATTNTFTQGTLAITIGSGTAVNVTIDGTNNTLSGIRSAINSANAGVTASIVNDGSYQRLLLTSNTLGSSGAIGVAVTDSGSGGSFALGQLASAGLTSTQPAQDAQLTINGLTITRSSNTITDAIEGVTLNLVDAGNTTLKVAKNTTAVVTAFDGFVKAFNAARTQISSLSGYNSETKRAAILTGDTAVRSVMARLNQLAFSQVTGIDGGISSLSNIGITLQKDGTLSLDTATLTSALNDPTKDVKSLLTQTTSGNSGIAVRFSNELKAMVATNGLIDSRTTGINASIESLQQRSKALQDRLVRIEQRYRTQFSALDSTIASLNQTSQYLTQQLAKLPGASSN
ncbi:MAG: flagellar hook protein [Rhodocyclaceae bacterium]|nr:flagellar hook protein [Rhodocyclaceae bacterium]